MQEMLNPLAIYSTAQTSRQETWKERKKEREHKIKSENSKRSAHQMFIGRGHQKDERSDPVVKCANPRLGVGGRIPWSSAGHKALESSKIVEHFEQRKHRGGWWGSGSQTWTSDWEAEHRIQLLESFVMKACAINIKK